MKEEGKKEVRWWATDRLVRGPTVTLAAFRSLRPCTCWIMADRRGGVGLQWRASVMRNHLTASWSTPRQHGGLTCKSTGRTRRQLRGDRRGYSRPARRDVPPAGVWCVPGWPVTIPSAHEIDVGLVRVDLTPIGARNPSCYSV